MHMLLLSPYHSGSHRAWAEGLQAHSTHDVTLMTLSGSFWKWRMHGGAVTLARRVMETDLMPVDLVLVDDMFDLPTFIALTRHKLTHASFALYMHENQLLYPLPSDQKKGPMRRNWGLRERQYVLINWKSMLAADHIYFNSAFHKNRFFEELPRFLSHYQSHNEIASIPPIQQKSSVLPVGINLTRFDPYRPGTDSANSASTISRSKTKSEKEDQGSPPLILWNQRWEFDKNPEGFCDVVRHLDAQGIDFRLALCGERFQSDATVFDQLKSDLGERIVHFGFAEAERYASLLWEADMTISTAYHEFFGISILEAIYCETIPFLPNRLSYPELIPRQFHTDFLYANRPDLINRLILILTDPDRLDELKMKTKALVFDTKIYDWPTVIGRYDQKLRVLVQKD